MKIKLSSFLKQMLQSKLIKALRFIKWYKRNINYRLGNKIKHKPKKFYNIVFIIQYPEVWNSLKSVYEVCLQSKNIKPFIICIPKPINLNTESLNYNYKNNEAYQFLCSQNIPCRAALNENNKWFDIQELKPDYIFYSRPYNDEYPKMYRNSECCLNAITCYIPYAYNMMDDHFYTTFNTDFITNTRYTFVANQSRLKLCQQEYYFQNKLGINQFIYLGFPRFDLLKQYKIKNTYKKDKYIIAWLPRWTVPTNNSENKQSSFLQYKDKFLNLIEENSNLSLIIRPHPLMFKNFIQNGVMTEQEVSEFKKECDRLNIEIDQHKDYLVLFEKSDILVADYTSLLMEYFATEKPIIYCDTAEGLNREAQIMDSALYHADNFDKVTQLIKQLSHGNDSMLHKRQEALKEIIPDNEGNIGEKIINFLIEERNKQLKGYKIK